MGLLEAPPYGIVRKRRDARDQSTTPTIHRRPPDGPPPRLRLVRVPSQHADDHELVYLRNELANTRDLLDRQQKLLPRMAQAAARSAEHEQAADVGEAGDRRAEQRREALGVGRSEPRRAPRRRHEKQRARGLGVAAHRGGVERREAAAAAASRPTSGPTSGRV